MNNKLLNQLNKKFEQLLQQDRRQADLEFEDSMLDDFSALFADEFGAEVDEGSFRAHGWYYVDFTLNGKKGILYYHPTENGGDIKYNNRYVTKDDSALPVEELFSKFHKMLDKLNKDVNASTRMPRKFTKYPSNYVKASKRELSTSEISKVFDKDGVLQGHIDNYIYKIYPDGRVRVSDANDSSSFYTITITEVKDYIISKYGKQLADLGIKLYF